MIRDQLLSTVTNWDHLSSLIARELNEPTYIIDSDCSYSPCPASSLKTENKILGDLQKNKYDGENKILGDLQKNKNMKFTENERF
jgi:hypothetical protein